MRCIGLHGKEFVFIVGLSRRERDSLVHLQRRNHKFEQYRPEMVVVFVIQGNKLCISIGFGYYHDGRLPLNFPASGEGREDLEPHSTLAPCFILLSFILHMFTRIQSAASPPLEVQSFQLPLRGGVASSGHSAGQD